MKNQLSNTSWSCKTLDEWVAVKWEDERFKLHKYLGGHTQEAGICLQTQGGHE
jgi:hypothetical protein